MNVEAAPRGRVQKATKWAQKVSEPRKFEIIAPNKVKSMSNVLKHQNLCLVGHCDYCNRESKNLAMSLDTCSWFQWNWNSQFVWNPVGNNIYHTLYD